MSTHMSVLTSPGWITLAVTPLPAISAARCRVSWLRATFDVPYALFRAPGGWRDAAEVMLTIRPQPASSIPARKARVVRYGAMASMRTVRTQSCGSPSWMSAIGPKVPAALTRIVGAPTSARTRSPSAITASTCETSAVIGMTVRPASLASAAVSASCASLRATATTVAPAPASPSAAPRPRPRPPPVTTAIRPAWSAIALALRPGLEVEHLVDRAGVDDALVVELHQRVHDRAPLVVDLRVPQPVPRLLVADLGVQEQHGILLEDRDLGDPVLLDLRHELGPDVVVVALVLGQAAGLEPHRERAPDHGVLRGAWGSGGRGRCRRFGVIRQLAGVDRVEQRRLVETLARCLAGQSAAIEHEDTVRQARELGQLRRPEQDDAALGCQPPHEQVDLPLRADVHAPRRVIQQHHARRDLEPLADDDLLLVAARELADGHPRAVGLDLQVRDLPLRGHREVAAPEPRRAGRERPHGDVRDVAGDRRVEHQAAVAAVGGDEPEPAAGRVRR